MGNRPLLTIAATESMERFSYYGMRALLVLYLIAAPVDGGAGLSSSEAFAIYGAYVSLVYLTPLLGGFLADRFFGARRMVAAGGVVIAAGHFVMAVPSQVMFFTGLGLIAVGTGGLKPNISAMVADVDPDPARRDANFSVLYTAINVGSLAAPLVTGVVASVAGWHVAFATAGAAMVLALIVYGVGWSGLARRGVGAAPDVSSGGRALGVLVAWVAAGVLVFVAAVFAHAQLLGVAVSPALVTQDLTLVLVAAAVVLLVRLVRTPGMSASERSRARSFVFVFAAAVVFFLIFDQAGSVLNVFASQYVVLGPVPPAVLQSVNPLFIVVFAPLFALAWLRLGARAPSVPTRFALALVGVGVSFGLMVVPGLAADSGVSSSVVWLLGVYLVQTWAELLLSPVGLSVSTHLAPAGRVSQVVALWFLATAVGDSVGGQVAAFAASWPLGVYFAVVGSAAVLAGVAVFPFSRRLARAMG